MKLRKALRLVLSTLLGAASVAAAETTYLPGAAEVTGLAGARFSSTLELTNPGSAAVTATIGLVPLAGKTAPAPVTRTLAAGEGMRVSEVLKSLFGIEDGGAGTITVSSDTPLLLSLSTQNVAAPEGPYGLGLLAVPESELLGAGETGHSIWVSQSADPGTGYRTNLSVTLVDPGTVVVVRVLDATGRVAGTTTLTATEAQVWQQPVSALTGAVDLPLARAEFEVKAGRATAYAVVNDNVTSDAIAVQSERLPVGPADRFVSGAAYSPGLLGAFWVTDLRIFNPGTSPVDATVLSVGAPHGASLVVPVPPGGVVEEAGILAALGFPERTACALRVTASAPLLVAARTNNVDRTGVRKGTFSAQQYVTSWPAGLLGAGETGFFNGVDQTLSVPGARTNLAIVGGPDGAAGSLVLRDAAGAERGRAAFSRGPGEWGQLGVADWFASSLGTSASRGSLGLASVPDNARIDVLVDRGALDAYVSRIDNGSGDAVTRPVARPGGDCTKVAISAFSAPLPVKPGVATTFSWTLALDPPTAGLTSQTLTFDGEAPIDLDKDARTYTKTFAAAGSRTATLTVRRGSCVKSRSLSIVVCGDLAIEPTSLPGGGLNAPYSAALTAPAGASPLVFSVASGSLPSGLSLSPAGQISGRPTSAGAYVFTVGVVDANGCSGSRPYTLQISCPRIQVAPSTLPSGTTGVPYGPVAMTATGASGTVTWTAVGLPPGLTLASDGTLSGTPTTAGSYPVTLKAADSAGCSGTATYTFVVCNTLTVAPSSLAAATAGAPFAPTTFTVTGASGAATWAVTTGSLPAGMTLDGTTGVLSGTPTVVGAFPITITATDSLGCRGSVALTLTVACPTIAIAPASLADGTAGVAYGPLSLTQTGGLGATSYTVTAGALPAGLALSGAGVLSGMPTAVGTFSFTVTATDANGCTGSRAYSLTIACPTIAIAPASLAGGTAGVAYGTVSLTQTGGLGATTYTVTAGALPAGLTLSGAGVLSGTPTAIGTFNFTVTATDANGCTGTRAYSLAIACPTIAVSPATVPSGTAGVAYAPATFTQSGGVGAVAFSLFAGSLPNGMSLSAAGVLSGTPTQTGSFPITVRATDANGCTGDRALTLTIACPAITVSPSSIPGGTAGVVYPGATFTATGGIGAITFSLFAGTLPNGMSLSAAGALFGTPTQTGSFPITVRATDANGCTGDRTVTFTIACPTIVATPAAALAGTEGSALGPVAFTQTGAVGAVVWSSTGTLPAGVTFSAAGVLSGTPATGSAGPYTVTFTATDQNLCTGSVQLTFRICPVITVGPTPISAFLQNQPYSETLAATGGVAPYTFAVSAGTLPANVTLASGLLSGTPTTLQAYDFTITATDANGCTGSARYTGRVCPVITIPTNLPNGVVGTAYSQTVVATGSPDTPYTYSVTGGTLPDGLTLAGGGLLAGTPTTGGSFGFTITATDANGCTGSRTYTVEVCVSPSITPTPASVCALSTGNSASGPAGATTYAWSISNGTITSATDQQTVTYTAGASGNVALTLTVTSAASCSTTASLNVPINASPATPAITGIPAGGVCAASTGNTASGPAGATTYAWTIAGGTIPGATNAQTVTYTAGASGSVTLTLTVTNASGCAASNNATATINANPATPAITGVPAGGVCAGSTGNTATGPAGATTYAWTITGGTIPGVTNAQTVTYTAGASGSVTLTLAVTNASGCAASNNATATINANPATPTITPAKPRVCTTSAGNTASGPAGATTYKWTVTNGTISGLDNLQTVTYTAGASGSVTLTLVVTNASGCSASNTATVPIDPTPTLSPAAGGLTATFGAAYSQAFTATGGAATFTYTLTPATPLPGLAFNTTTGVLSGTPNATGTWSFTVQATSDVGCVTATQAYTLAVAPSLGNDAYSGVGNTQLYVTGVSGAPATPAVASATAALANDTPAGGVTVTGVSSPCVGLGGTMTIDSAGRFVYTAPVGTSGTDVCTYTASSNTGGTVTPATATATISIALTNRVWYVNGAAVAGDGRSQSPFSSLASASAVVATNDVVFVESALAPTTTPGAITMPASTILWGQGAALPQVGGIAIQNTGATAKPVVTGTVTLGGSGVLVSSLDVSTSGAVGLTDNQALPITGITVQNNVTVTATNAAAVVLSGVTASATGMTFTSLTSTNSSAKGIDLSAIGGSFTSATTAVTNPATVGIDVQTSVAAGTINFGTTTSNASGGTGVNLATNAGAVTFGALNVAPDANQRGLLATENSGTLTVTSGTITTTGNTAVEITKTSGTTPLAVSLTAVNANGGPNGISLSRTSGSFTVAGTGTAGSGGTIQGTTGHGINLATVSGSAGFSWMNVTNSGLNGILGSGVGNFTCDHCAISDNAGSNTTDDGIGLSNTSGTLTISNSTITGSRHQGITIDNFNTNLGTLTLSGTTVTGTVGGDGVLMQMRGTSVLTAGTISSNTFSNSSSTGLQVNNADTGNIQSLTVSGNTVNGNNAGMDFDLSQGSSMTIVVQGNTITNSHSQALNLVASTSATGGTMTATLRNNTIGIAGVNDSGSAIGNGIRVANGGVNVILTIDGNVIREVPNGRGIDIEPQAYVPNLNVKARIVNNQVIRPSGTNQSIGCGPGVPCPLASIFVVSDNNNLGGFDNVCTVVSGNTAYDPTSWPAGGEAAFYFARRTTTSNFLNLEGNTGQTPSANVLGTNTVTNNSGFAFFDEGAPTLPTTVVAVGTCGSFPP